MTYLYNDPVDFADELTDGFAAAYGDWVTQVAGGVVRATVTPPGQVAVITGGGSGHYPAFAGLVGPGLTHGAAMGNIFASPSAQQVYNVAKGAHVGGGVLLTYGNYAGDVLNFSQAQERLIAEGIACRTVVVTDDIASAAPAEHHKRRGIAGDLFVFKAAAAAAEEGQSLDDVAAVAARANQVTRSFGVAFAGCTLPGANKPLFTIPPGRMGVGMGIHGEPGIAEEDIPTAHGLAELLVEQLLAECPSGAGDRVVVLLNGLGSVKYEELFVLYRSVNQLLTEAELIIVQPDVGELVTSFQMAGVSLTLAWLDEDLERYWHAPTSTPAYRKGNRQLGERRPETDLHVTAHGQLAATSDESRAAAGTILAAMETIVDTIDANAEYLGELDAVAGDGDHGIGMQRGARAALVAAREHVSLGAGAGSVLQAAADAWADRAGGTSGALWGTLLGRIASELGDTQPLTGNVLSSGFSAGIGAVQAFGKAERGDKTMVDALLPFGESFEGAIRTGKPVSRALSIAADEAESAARSTMDLVPKIGRARPHARKSLGSPDPGAISLALIAQALAGLSTRTDG